MDKPKVSVIIPVYNGSDFLADAIDSALAQSYSNVEVLVVNDGSSDEGQTAKIAQRYGDRIRYFEQRNGGVASALNLAISQATGEYVSWLSHDDLYYPDKLDIQVQLLAGMTDCDRVVSYGDYAIFFDTDVNALTEMHLPDTPPEQFRYFITTQNSLHGCTLLVPKHAFDECGGFNVALRTTQDYDLWYRMAEKYRFIHIPKLLVKARAHAGQGSVAMKDTAIIEINTLLSAFVKGLSERELHATGHNSVGLAYADLYKNLHLRGFHGAAKTAWKLAWDHLSSSSVLAKLQLFSIFAHTQIRKSLLFIRAKSKRFSRLMSFINPK